MSHENLFRRIAPIALVLAVVSAARVSAQGLTITTVAGDTSLNSPAPNGFSGDGGQATRARMALPDGVAIDSAGNIYIADTANNRIRKVSNGIMTTIAGSGNSYPNAGGFGGDNGPATSALLKQPTGVAIAPNGDIYIADQGNSRIRKITVASGNISTLAGTGGNNWTSGNEGALPANVPMCFPFDLTFDSSGNLYYTDTGNMAVRKISIGAGGDGKVHTLAGPNGSSQTILCGQAGGFSGDGGLGTSAKLNN